MADQGKWFKLHVDWDDDPHIDSLSLENQVRWVKFGTYTKKHGTEGKLVLVDPARALQNKFRVGSFEEVIQVLKLFPNYDIGEKHKRDGDCVTSVIVTIKNWAKYQADNSAARTARWRKRVTPKKRGEEKRRDKEEKRGVFIPPTPAQAEEYARSINFSLDGEKFVASYAKVGWKDKNGNRITDWKSCVVSWKKYAVTDRGGAAMPAVVV